MKQCIYPPLHSCGFKAKDLKNRVSVRQRNKLCFCRIKGACFNSSARIEYYQTANVMNTSFQLLKQLYMLYTVWIHFSSELTVFHIPGLNCAGGHLRDLV